MPSTLENFPSVKLLICVLCAIVFFGIAYVVSAIERVSGDLAALRESLEDEIANAVQSGITNVEQQRNRDIEMECLDAEASRIPSNLNSNAVVPEPFVFTIDSEVAAFMEELKRGGVAESTLAKSQNVQESAG